MKNILIAVILTISAQANAKSLKVQAIGAALSIRLSAGIEKYVPSIKDATRASAEVSNGAITLKVYEPNDCDTDSKQPECEGPAEVAYEVSLQIFEKHRFECAKDENGRKLYGVRYQAETPHEVWGEFYESIVLIDNSQCPKSDRGVGYLTYTAEGARGPGSMQFFVDQVYKTFTTK